MHLIQHAKPFFLVTQRLLVYGGVGYNQSYASQVL